MAVATAVGDMATAEDVFRDMLSRCDTWRAMCAEPDDSWPDVQTASAASPVEGDAKDRVHRDLWEYQDNALPRALVLFVDDELGRVGSGAWEGEGNLGMAFFLPIPSEFQDSNGYCNEADMEDCSRDIKNRLGAIKSELIELSRSAGTNNADILNIRTSRPQPENSRADDGGGTQASEFAGDFEITFWMGA